MSYLLSLAVAALLDELAEAVRCGYRNPLETRFAAAVAPPILSAALSAVDLARRAHLTANEPVLHNAGAALDLVSTDQQVQILEWMLRQRGVSIKATSLVEGAIAVRSSDAPAETGADAHGAGQAVAAGVQHGGAGALPPPIEKGGWGPPGEQPIPLYVGTEVHNAIARNYVAAHPGQPVATNTTPITTILEQLNELAAGTADRTKLDQDELLLRPDILNLRLRHLFEIKPEAAQAQGASKAARYCSIFSKAGVVVALGPMGEPGTTGQLPAPDGTVMFECTEPGVITYRYRHSRLVPVPVPVPAPSKKRSRDWKWAFENDLTPDQKAAMATTTVGGAVLILLMVVLAPLGA